MSILLRYNIDDKQNLKIYMNTDKLEDINDLFIKIIKNFPIDHDLFFAFKKDNEIGIARNSCRDDFDLNNISNDINNVLLPNLRLLLRDKYHLEPINYNFKINK